jgi:hypothetical protein
MLADASGEITRRLAAQSGQRLVRSVPRVRGFSAGHGVPATA